MAFIEISGVDFTLNGKKWLMNGGTTYNINSSPSDIDQKWAAALSMDLNTVRMVNFFGHTFYDDDTQWEAADYGLDQARQLGLKVLLDFSDMCAVVGNLHPGDTCNVASGRQDWYDFVEWIMNRVNTVNGRVYKNDDTIAVIAISGENSFQGGTIIHDFFSDVTAAIKAEGAQQIVHPGGQIPEIIIDSSYGLSYSQDMLSIATVDCVSTHPYYTQGNMRTLFPLLQDYSRRKNKPWFIEEFGYNQSVSPGKYDKTRAQLTKFVYDIGLQYGCAGFIFWNIDNGYWNPQTDSGGGFGVNTNTPETFKLIKSYSKYTRYSPRIPVDSVNPPIT